MFQVLNSGQDGRIGGRYIKRSIGSEKNISRKSFLGLFQWSSDKESTCPGRRHGFNPWLGN